MRKLMIALTAAAVTVPAVMPAPAEAQSWRCYNRDWGEVRAYDYNR